MRLRRSRPLEKKRFLLCKPDLLCSNYCAACSHLRRVGTGTGPGPDAAQAAPWQARARRTDLSKKSDLDLTAGVLRGLQRTCGKLCG